MKAGFGEFYNVCLSKVDEGKGPVILLAKHLYYRGNRGKEKEDYQ